MLKKTLIGIFGGLAALAATAIGFNSIVERRRPDLAPPVNGTARDLYTQDGTLRIYEAGNGPPVLLIHSFNAAGTTYEMKPVFEELSRDHRVIAFDWLGFGLSDRPKREYHPGLYERVLRRVMDDIGPGPIDVVALSLPSQYVAIMAAESPERFGRIVLLSPTGLGKFSAQSSGSGDIAIRFFELPLIGRTFYNVLTTKPIIGQFLDQIYADPSRLDPGYEDYAWATTQQPGALNAPIYFVAGLLNDGRAASAYEDLSVPTLMVFGDRPRFTDPAAAANVASRNDAIRIETIPDSGDLPQWEQRDATLPLIRDFLASTERGTGSSVRNASSNNNSH